MYPKIFAFTFLAIPLVASTCHSLSSLSLPDTTITSAQLVEGSFTPPGAANAITLLPPFCRVEAAIRPSSDSSIRIEVWLPVSGWNGKLQGIGNGGFAGAISYGPTGLAGAIRRGYAAASTDTGHAASSAGVDASWALNHPEKLIDYGHRAIHLMTVQAKAIVKAFYGDSPRQSYFASCSNGGRQALMEAQRYPEDYDGIVAGAPANDFTHLLLGFAWNTQALARTRVPADKLASIEAAMLQSCDGADGLKDNLIADPTKCKFDPGRVVTAEEAKTLKAIYSGPKTSKGAQIFPGFPPGAETGPGGWNRWILSQESLQQAFASQFLKNMVFGDPAYDPLSFNFDRDVAVVDAKVGAILNATNPDLGSFHRRGGKLILFHGWNDPAIPAPYTIRYYEQVRRTMGAKTADSFLRLYMAPGVQHCGAGPGPNSFGAYGEGEAELFTAVEQWVEHGKPPNRIRATKYIKDGEPASGVARTRPLCPYPQVARYKGSGSIDEFDSFACKAP